MCSETDCLAILEIRKLKAQVISADDAYFPVITVAMLLMCPIPIRRFVSLCNEMALSANLKPVLSHTVRYISQNRAIEEENPELT